MHIDSLEPRRLFSATAYLHGNVLHVIGTDGDDTIELKSVPNIVIDASTTFTLDVTVNNEKVGSFANWDQISRIAIEAGAGNDRITMPDRFLIAETGSLNPSVDAAVTDDYRTIRAHVSGGAGNDTITGGAGNDLLEGNGGNDNLAGNDGNDDLFGGTGQDKLNGDNGDDQLDGGKGNDGLAGGMGADTFIGGAGSDTVDYSDHTQAVIAVLSNAGDAHVAVLFPLDGFGDFYGMGKLEHDNMPTDVENIKGGSGDDQLTGNSSANVIVGGEGNDTLTGGDGADSLYGNAGNDHFTSSDDAPGGRGIGDFTPVADRVIGGAGRDDGSVDSIDTILSVEHPTIVPAT